MSELSNVTTQKFVLFNTEKKMYVEGIHYLIDYPCGYTDGITSSPKLFDEDYYAEGVIHSLERSGNKDRNAEAQVLEVIPVDCKIILNRN